MRYKHHVYMLEQSMCEEAVISCALRTEAMKDARKLRDSSPGARRITWRLYVIADLAAYRKRASRSDYQYLVEQVRAVIAGEGAA